MISFPWRALASGSSDTNHVELVSRVRCLLRLELTDEKIHVLHEQWLLQLECTITKCIRQNSSHTSVVSVVAVNYVEHAVCFILNRLHVEFRAFEKCRLIALLVSINLLPCLAAIEAEFVWREPYHLAILLMELCLPEWNVTSQIMVDVWNATKLAEEWSGIIA